MFLAGADPKAGKSMFALELARALATASTPFDCPLLSVPETTRVLYVEQEIGEHGLQKRAQKIFTNDIELVEKNLFYVSKVPDLKLNTNKGRALLDEFISAVQPGVLILDPLAQIHNYEEVDNTQIGKLFNTFAEVVRKYQHNDMSIVLIHHMRKKGGNSEGAIDPLSTHNYRGSSRFAADPDTLVTINRGEEFKSRQGRAAWKISVRWNTRQSEAPEDMIMTVNALDDLRVRWEAKKGAMPKLSGTKGQDNTAAEQYAFAEASPYGFSGR